MLDIYTDVATDEAAELNGTWLPYREHAKLLIARSNNPKYLDKLSDLIERNRAALDKEDEAAKELSNDILAEVFATTLLLGWEGVGYKGVELDYSVENAKTLLRHKQFRLDVASLADDVSNFRLKLEVEAEKN